MAKWEERQMMVLGSVHPWESPRAKNEPTSSVISAKAEKTCVCSPSSKMSLGLGIAAYLYPPTVNTRPLPEKRSPTHC